MDLFQLDRVQYYKDKDKEKFIVYEFNKFIYIDITKYSADRYLLDYATYHVEKYSLLLRLLESGLDIEVYFIFYSDIEEEDKIIYNLKSGEKKIDIEVCNMARIKEKFVELNGVGNEDGLSSKPLGSSEEENDKIPEGVKRILHNIFGEVDYNDGGWNFTKKLLTKVENGVEKKLNTNGFDVDLFQYVRSTGQYIIYEFARNKKRKLTNYQCHPMRYSWECRSTDSDNRTKYNSLWKFTQALGGKFFIVNYSDYEDDGIGISEVLGIDEKYGFTGEYKYNMTYQNFKEWLVLMGSYNRNHSQYLQDFEDIKRFHDVEYFRKWNDNSETYE